MSFFKKIGKFVKKNVNLKTLVKVGTMWDPTGMSGGIVEGVQGQRDAKKQQANEAMVAQIQAMQQAQQGMSPQLVRPSSSSAMSMARSNPNFNDIMLGMGSGAATGLGQVLASGQTGGQMGAQVVDSTMNAWFTKHKSKLFIVGGILVALLVYKKMFASQPRRRY